MSVLYTCEICGAQCVGHINARYCPECRGEVKKSTRRESKARAAARGKAKAGAAGRPLTLGQIAARARRLHMSYGEFVAKYGL